ncbi:hypothetical protein HLK59_07695 [Streptomyces sp. S3(2020)]|uniref:hypothetical protein n=1 Tax=Streptomyces sp. S3(2020) TaxID=2732044 RepID=UPI00148822FE|nr:hypothetical protein [Streptomyces sp. S3(2020)]NNN30248.1 hypothetical protein [Streptomyces sp. S3(2020)]
MYHVLSAQAVASGAFYATETFWTAVGVPVAALLGCGTIWAAFRVAHPRRRLICTVSHTSLVRGPIDGSLEISRNGTPLTDPHLVTVVLTNPGRRDIASSAFDRGEPFRVRFAVPYAELLRTESLPDDAQAPPTRMRGTELHIGPGRLGAGTTVTYHLLVDTVPTYDFRHSLLDVRVHCTAAPTPRGLSRTLPLVRP